MGEQVLSAGGRTLEAVRALQKKRFESGSLHDRSERLRLLDLLATALREHSGELVEALKEDLGRSSFEAYVPDIGLVLEEIKFGAQTSAIVDESATSIHPDFVNAIN